MVSKISSSEDPARTDRLRRVGGSLRQMTQRLDDARERAARQQSLHPTDFACIGYLNREGRAVSPKEIGPHLGLSSGSITALLDRLEKAGLIHRVSNPDDRRSVLIELDQVAARDIVTVYLQIENAYRNVADGFSDEQLEVIATFLERMSRISALTEGEFPALRPLASSG